MWNLDAFFDTPESFFLSIKFCQVAGPRLSIRNVFRSPCGHAALGLCLHCSSEGWGNRKKCPSQWRTGDCREGKTLSARDIYQMCRLKLLKWDESFFSLCTDWCKRSADTSRQAGTAEHLCFTVPKVPQSHHHWRGGELDMSFISFGV